MDLAVRGLVFELILKIRKYNPEPTANSESIAPKCSGMILETASRFRSFLTFQNEAALDKTGNYLGSWLKPSSKGSRKVLEVEHYVRVERTEPSS